MYRIFVSQFLVLIAVAFVFDARNAYGQIRLDATSKTIFGNAGPPPSRFDSCWGEEAVL